MPSTNTPPTDRKEREDKAMINVVFIWTKAEHKIYLRMARYTRDVRKDEKKYESMGD